MRRCFELFIYDADHILREFLIMEHFLHLEKWNLIVLELLMMNSHSACIAFVVWWSLNSALWL